ncbi:alpha/beta fold hydrolase [Paraglaciecola marina]|uniref:alpha/beta fold hydrolase n=1 Tax=Paraglaciecola marina TaxID=2500157 RepID=UPI00105BF891|nr:alpha/beta hydrolase [Paraglaciecola marina]
MFTFTHSKKTRFLTRFVTVFIATVVFQIAVNYKAFATKQAAPHNQFRVEVSGAGRPIILIPGLMSDSRVWEQLAGTLSASYELHMINVAGFAATPAVTEPSITELKAQLLAYIHQRKLHKPIIIGHSLGGFMALWLASSAPKEIGPVISVDGLPFIGPIFTRSNDTTVQSLAAQAKQIKQMYSNMSQQQLIEQSRYSLPVQASTDAAKAKVMAMIETSDPTTAGHAIHSLMSHDLRQDIAKISSPVLLLGASGGFDSDSQQTMVDALYKQQLSSLPHAKLVMNTKARHFIMFDDPSWFEHQVLNFLEAQL